METQTLNYFSLTRAKDFVPTDNIINIGDDFFMAERTNEANYDLMRHPSRIDAYVVVFCKSGNFKCNINLKEYEISEGMILVNLPQNIISVEPKESADKPTLTLIGVSPKFLSNFSSDISKMLNEAITLLDDPCLYLEEDELSIVTEYIQLIDKHLHSEYAYARESVSHLISSVFYLFGSFINQRIMSQKEVEKPASTRHKMVFERFLELVTQHHNKERSVGFYADKLCITPKYLSKIVKDTSGLSAPQWIDQYVILEAKQMLKHSDRCVKEISDDLNFPNPSFFFKYFKTHTGMTPNQYRNS